MSISDFKSQLNEWGHHKVPFLFLIDFEMKKPRAWRLDEVDADELLYSMHHVTNSPLTIKPSLTGLQKNPGSLEDYKTKFESVYKSLQYGDSFLTNLTVRTPIQVTQPLQDIFLATHARYKMWLKDQFLFFSPEIFIQIRDGKIYSFPMKGTLDASIPDAKNKLLQDKKEMAEHVTIVDLIRNDLSHVATNVSVARFRYIEEIVTKEKTLLQVSSEITGELPRDYVAHLGDIVVALLPAGSISGAPKPKTTEIIRTAEGGERGYYTGVAGYFDGTNLDSGVAIRFIEQEGNTFYYRSGGGITTQSNVEEEYKELLDKIYVPVA